LLEENSCGQSRYRVSAVKLFVIDREEKQEGIPGGRN